MTIIRPKRLAHIPTSLQDRQKKLQTLQARQTQYQSLDCVFQDRLNKEEQHKKTQDRVARNSGAIKRKHPVLAKALQDILGKFETPYQGQSVTTVVRDKYSRSAYSRKTNTLASPIPPTVYRSIKKQRLAATEKKRHEPAVFIKTKKLSSRIRPIVPQSLKKLQLAALAFQAHRYDRAVQRGNVPVVVKLHSKPFLGLPRSLQKILFNAQKPLKSEEYPSYFEFPDRYSEAKSQQEKDKNSDRQARKFRNTEHAQKELRKIDGDFWRICHSHSKALLALVRRKDFSQDQGKGLLGGLLTFKDDTDSHAFQAMLELSQSGIKVPVTFRHKRGGFLEGRLQNLRSLGLLDRKQVNNMRVEEAYSAISSNLSRPEKAEEAIALFLDQASNGVLRIQDSSGVKPIDVFAGEDYQLERLPLALDEVIRKYVNSRKNRALQAHLLKNSNRPGPPPPPPPLHNRVNNSSSRQPSTSSPLSPPANA